MEFFRFPRTPHLLWLGRNEPRDDKVLPAQEAADLLRGIVLVEEKIDGANVGISLSDAGDLRAQNRGAYIDRQTCHPQFAPLFRWLRDRQHALADALGPDLILFGEWCYAVHSVQYTKLPDWFLAFDVYDRTRGEFWSAARRDTLVDAMGVSRVPTLGEGTFDLAGLLALMGASRVSTRPAEGVYVRRSDETRLVARAKLVRPEFTQQIDAHWSGRTMEINQLASGARW